MAASKKTILSFFGHVRDFCIKYPAVLSGYIIYAYFFITTMDFYKEIKARHFKSVDIVEQFDALIWMWVLAVVLVKIIEYRNRLNEQERLRIERESELELRGAQLATAHQLIRSLQHEINNPLTVILLYVQRTLRKEDLSPGVLEGLTEIKLSAERIADTLREFAFAQGVETIGSPVGDLITPSKQNDAARTVDEARSA